MKHGCTLLKKNDFDEIGGVTSLFWENLQENDACKKKYSAVKRKIYIFAAE